MSSLLALSLSIGVLGGIWAYLALGPLAGFVLVWAGFIAWGCYFHSGGDGKALTKTICGNIYGVVIAWIALLIIFKFGAGDAGVVAIAVVVAITGVLSGHRRVNGRAFGGSGQRLWLCRDRRLHAARIGGAGQSVGRGLRQPGAAADCVHGSGRHLRLDLRRSRESDHKERLKASFAKQRAACVKND
jgi:hypothetical protein